MKKGLILRSLQKNSTFCRALSFSENGANLLLGDDNGIVVIWEISLQKYIYLKQTQLSAVSSVSYWPENNKIFASSTYDGFIRFFDTRSNNVTIASFDHGCPVESFKFLDNGRKLVSMGGNKLKIWNFSERKLEYTLIEKKAITNLNIDCNDKIFYSGLDRNIKTFKLNLKKTKCHLSFKKNIISFACISDSIVIGFSEKIVLLRKSSSNKKIIKKKIIKNTQGFIERKKILFYNIFFLPKKKKFSIFENNKNYLNNNNNNKKISKIIKKSLDNLFRNNKIKNIFCILYENKNFITVFMIINELINQNRLISALNQIDPNDFIFLMNLITDNLKIIFTIELLKLLNIIAENFYPLFFIFISNCKIVAYLNILCNLIKKTIMVFNLKYSIEINNVYV